MVSDGYDKHTGRQRAALGKASEQIRLFKPHISSAHDCFLQYQNIFSCRKTNLSESKFRNKNTNQTQNHQKPAGKLVSDGYEKHTGRQRVDGERHYERQLRWLKPQISSSRLCLFKNQKPFCRRRFSSLINWRKQKKWESWQHYDFEHVFKP